jgi:hypothetical protein
VKYRVLDFACLQNQWKKQIDVELKTEKYEKLRNEKITNPSQNCRVGDGYYAHICKNISDFDMQSCI